MVGEVAFWSYVHADNQLDYLRLVRLAKLLEAEYEALTNRTLSVHTDATVLSWGSDWRQRLDEAIAEASFFIPILSPRFFTSTECRRELSNFIDAATRLGRIDLILPIKYIEVPDLQPDSDDVLKAILATRQYEDWTDLRFEEEQSGAYRRAVNRLAKRLLEVMERLPTISVAESSVPPGERPGGEQPTSDPDKDEDEPGVLEVLVAGESSGDDLNRHLENLGSLITEVGHLTQKAAEQMQRADGAGSSISRRLAISNRLGQQLAPISEQIDDESRGYTGALDLLDPFVSTLLGLLEDDRSQVPTAASFLKSLIDMDEQSETGLAALVQLAEVMDGAAKTSRALRAPIRRIQAALRRVSDSRPTMAVWADDARALLLAVGESEQHALERPPNALDARPREIGHSGEAESANGS